MIFFPVQTTKYITRSELQINKNQDFSSAVSRTSLVNVTTPCLFFTTLLPALPSVHQLQLTGGERQDPADVVGDPQGEEGDDYQQQQDPPEAQILHKLLPGGPEAGQDALTALQVWVE